MKLVLTSALLAAGAAASDARDWIRQPPSPMWEAEKLDSASIHKVLPAKRDEAVAQLKRSVLRALRGDDLATWTGPKAKCRRGTQAFLLRSVSNGDDEGTLQVRVRGASVLVSNGALGRNIELEPMPVVACLPAVPQELYVAYSTAE